MGRFSRIRVENAKDVVYERSGPGIHDWARSAIADDILARSTVENGLTEDILLPDQPVGQFIGNGMISHSYADFFRFEWMAFANSLLSGKNLSPSVKDAYRTVCLTDAICQSIRKGSSPVQIAY